MFGVGIFVTLFITISLLYPRYNRGFLLKLIKKNVAISNVSLDSPFQLKLPYKKVIQVCTWRVFLDELTHIYYTTFFDICQALISTFVTFQTKFQFYL